MTVRLTVHAFSGRPNPSVVLPPPLAASLLGATVTSTPAATPPAAFPRLGYRGVTIEHDEPLLASVLPTVSRVYRGAGRTADGREFAAPNLERYLLERGGLFEHLGMPPAMREPILQQALEVPPPAAAEDRGLGAAPPPPQPSAAADRAPLFEPHWWNDDAIKQVSNNCYNYATNYRTDTFAQPGRASGSVMSTVSCAQVLPFALEDQLLAAAENDNRFPDEGHLVALVIAPGFDFHWYRKGRDAMWTHKIGPEPATDVDNSGHPIVDPRGADRGPYTEFCGFLIVKPGHIKIQ